MSVLTETAPQHIWLCVSDEPDDYNTPYPELYAEDAEITWSTDQPVAVTVEYVRVDLSEVAQLRQQQADDAESLTAAANTIRDLRAERDALADELRDLDIELVRARRERDALQSLRALDLAALVELGKERDYATEMVNVQDNQIDALRALLREARAALPDMRHNELLRAKLDAALKDKP